MSKWLVSALAVTALMSGCASVQRGAIPVVDAGAPVSDDERVASRNSNAPVARQPQATLVRTLPGSATSSPAETYSLSLLRRVRMEMPRIRAA